MRYLHFLVLSVPGSVFSLQSLTNHNKNGIRDVIFSQPVAILAELAELAILATLAELAD